MRSFAYLDYLNLEINQVTLMKYLVADKSTQSDECQQITENGVTLPGSVTGKKIPPTRPPPPNIIKMVSEPSGRKNQPRKSGIDILFKKDTMLRRKLHTLKLNTIKLSKTVHRKMTRRLPKSQSDTNINHASTNSKLGNSVTEDLKVKMIVFSKFD